MFIYGVKVDVSRGFDVLRDNKILKHFEDYAEARVYADAGRGRVLRYFAEK